MATHLRINPAVVTLGANSLNQDDSVLWTVTMTTPSVDQGQVIILYSLNGIEDD
jgi:hypothetical protein